MKGSGCLVGLICSFYFILPVVWRLMVVGIVVGIIGAILDLATQILLPILAILLPILAVALCAAAAVVLFLTVRGAISLVKDLRAPDYQAHSMDNGLRVDLGSSLRMSQLDGLAMNLRCPKCAHPIAFTYGDALRRRILHCPICASDTQLNPVVEPSNGKASAKTRKKQQQLMDMLAEHDRSRGDTEP